MNRRSPIFTTLAIVFFAGLSVLLFVRTKYNKVILEFYDPTTGETVVLDSYIDANKPLRVVMGSDQILRIKDGQIKDSDEVRWKVGEVEAQGPEVTDPFQGDDKVQNVSLVINDRERFNEAIPLKIVAKVDAPSRVRVGDQFTISDESDGGKTRRWYIDGEEQASQEASWRTSFSNPGNYEIIAKITTADDEEHTIRKWVKVEEKPKQIAERKPRKTTTPKPPVNTKPSATISEPEPEPEPEEPVVEPETITVVDNSAAFTDNLDFNFSQRSSVTWVAAPKERCLARTTESSSFVLQNLSEDLCISKLYLVPGPNQNARVKVVFTNLRTGDQLTTGPKSVQWLRKNTPSPISVQNVGSKLKAGESYRIEVIPLNGSEFEVMSTTDESCFTPASFSPATIELSAKALVLKMDFMRK